MNDFTKAELQIIHLDVNTEINKHRGILKPSPSHLDLRDKIESMIENYCEHENDYRFNAVPEDGGLKMCKKCQRFYE